MKRYEFAASYRPDSDEDTVPVEERDGRYVTFDDHQAVLRRLLVKLCRERAQRLGMVARGHFRNGRPNARQVGNAIMFNQIADALESSQPLTYFARLGEDK